jgi:2-C-methyl-D-erythritol 2,4-cyclodiphosphate synthase
VSAAHPLPKQYTDLLGSPVLEWSLRALLAEPRVHAIVVVLAAGDAHWPAIEAKLDAAKLLTTTGGAQRQDSVMNGLDLLASQAAPDDWVLVHDAARPCLSRADLSALIDALDGGGSDSSTGGGSAEDIGSNNNTGDGSRNANAGGNPNAGGTSSTGASVGDNGSSVGDVGIGISSQSPVAGVVLAAPIVDTVRRHFPDHVETVDRTGLWRALTPQAFAFAPLRSALKAAAQAGAAVTDEAQAMERVGVRATLVRGSPFNIKITRAEDLQMAAGILQMTDSSRMRVGQGVDVHAFGAGDHVVLGGVRIAHPQGVVAHSDGDVVIHALCDALLGAMGDGDIGQHFPDSDPRYRGADSRVFLRAVAQRMKAAGLALVNADVTVLAEAPRIGAHRGAMAANLAADLGVPAQRVNIKATTTERLGFIGRKEGLAATASVLLAPGA